jgi:hypothetical protein
MLFVNTQHIVELRNARMPQSFHQGGFVQHGITAPMGKASAFDCDGQRDRIVVTAAAVNLTHAALAELGIDSVSSNLLPDAHLRKRLTAGAAHAVAGQPQRNPTAAVLVRSEQILQLLGKLGVLPTQVSQPLRAFASVQRDAFAKPINQSWHGTTDVGRYGG